MLQAGIGITRKRPACIYTETVITRTETSWKGQARPANLPFFTLFSTMLALPRLASANANTINFCRKDGMPDISKTHKPVPDNHGEIRQSANSQVQSSTMRSFTVFLTAIHALLVESDAEGPRGTPP